MVHQIVEEDGRNKWQTSTFVRESGLGGFVRNPNPLWTDEIDV